MDYSQREKIKKSVQTSAILSPQERAEWLALLDLMDDKQLLELEKILSPQAAMTENQKNLGPGSRETQIANQARKAPQSGSQVNLGSGQALGPKTDLKQMPKLSHILNLPKLEASDWQTAKPAGVGQNLPSSTQTPPVFNGSNPPEGNDKSGFAAKLKSIFSEKELPAGKSKSPALELPGGTAAELNSKTPAVATEPNTPVFSTAQLKAPIKTGSKILTHAESGKTSAASEINFGTPSKKDVNVTLKNLDDLTLLNSKVLQAGDFNFMVKSIRDLISKYGYHEAVFKIEDSPLYKMYIKTGLEALSKQASFEQLSGGGPLTGYLNRQQFEKTADLLRQIQAG